MSVPGPSVQRELKVLGDSLKGLILQGDLLGWC